MVHLCHHCSLSCLCLQRMLGYGLTMIRRTLLCILPKAAASDTRPSRSLIFDVFLRMSTCPCRAHLSLGMIWRRMRRNPKVLVFLAWKLIRLRFLPCHWMAIHLHLLGRPCQQGQHLARLTQTSSLVLRLIQQLPLSQQVHLEGSSRSTQRQPHTLSMLFSQDSKESRLRKHSTISA